MTPAERHLHDQDMLRYCDNEADPADRARVEQHLAACAFCQRRLDALRTATLALQELHRQDDHPETLQTRSRARLLSRLDHLEPTATPRSLPRWLPLSPGARWVWGAAAAVLVAVGLGAALLPGSPVAVSRVARRNAGNATDAIERSALPLRAITPGATVGVTADALCRGERVPVPDVLPASLRQDVLKAYRMEHVSPDEYELDYLITPELGGATLVSNLWPERYDSRVWNAAVKDQLEDLLPALVCKGEIDLEAAQRDIAVNWIEAYKKYFRTTQPILREARADDLVILPWSRPGR